MGYVNLHIIYTFEDCKSVGNAMNKFMRVIFLLFIFFPLNMCVYVCFKHFWNSEHTSRLQRFIPLPLESVDVELLIPKREG